MRCVFHWRLAHLVILSIFCLTHHRKLERKRNMTMGTLSEMWWLWWYHSICAFHLCNIISSGFTHNVLFCCDFIPFPEKRRKEFQNLTFLVGSTWMRLHMQSNKQKCTVHTSEMLQHPSPCGLWIKWLKSRSFILLCATWIGVRAAFVWALSLFGWRLSALKILFITNKYKTINQLWVAFGFLLHFVFMYFIKRLLWLMMSWAFHFSQHSLR